MSEPIPVKDALKLIEMALEEESKATKEPWVQDDDCFVFAKSVPHRIHEFGFNPRIVCETDQQRDQAGADMDFIVLARATMRPMLECIDEQIRVSYRTDEELPEGHYFYPSIAALRDHYDRVRPNWRTK